MSRPYLAGLIFATALPLLAGCGYSPGHRALTGGAIGAGVGAATGAATTHRQLNLDN